MVVGDQRSGDRRAGLVVVPDGGGHGQDPLGDADGDAFEGPPAVGFQVELALGGVEASPGTGPGNAVLILAFAQLRG